MSSEKKNTLKTIPSSSSSRLGLIDNELFKVPDLSLLQARFDLRSNNQEVSNLAKEKIFNAIRTHFMVPYYKLLCTEEPGYFQLDSSIISPLEQQLNLKLEEIEKKILDAESTEGESEIFNALAEKAILYCSIGDKEKSLSSLRVIQEKALNTGTKLDIIFAFLRVGFFFSDYEILKSNLEKANR